MTRAINIWMHHRRYVCSLKLGCKIQEGDPTRLTHKQ